MCRRTPAKEAAVDLTAMSATMVYAEVYNMVVSPEEYVGRTVIMEGAYQVYDYYGDGTYYHAVIIKDATACCSQGLEFTLGGDYKYPEDFPADGTSIKVTGVFTRSVEANGTFYLISADTYELV